MSIHARGADQHADGRLQAVLRVAAAPAHPAELAGEQEAVAAFRAAAIAAPKRSLLARILTVKVLAIGGVAVSTGVVLAAVSGVLPPPWPERPAGPTVEVPAVVTTVSPSAETPPTGNPSSSTDPPQATTTPTSPTEPSDDPSRQPHGGPGDDKDKKDKGDRDDDQDDDQDATTATEPDETRDRSRTPDSSAPGAVTAVPPSGAVPPTKGD